MLAFERQFEVSDIYGGVLGSGTNPDLAPKIQSSAADSFPRISPDGTQVAFVSSRSGWAEIWIASQDGTQSRQISHLETRAGAPTWSPDGAFLAFEGVGEHGVEEIFTADVATGRTSLLNGGQGREILPDWSPDGKWIYFTSNRSGTYEIWKVSPTGGEPAQVTAGGGFGARQSADGKYLYLSRGPAQPGLFRMPIGGRSVETIVADYQEPDLVRWAVSRNGVYLLDEGRGPRRPDGRQGGWSIRFWSERDQKVRPVAFLTRAVPSGVGSLDVSPDGGVLISLQQIDESDILLIDKF